MRLWMLTVMKMKMKVKMKMMMKVSDGYLVMKVTQSDESLNSQRSGDF